MEIKRRQKGVTPIIILRNRVVLDNYEEYLPKFKKIIPADYKKMMELTESYIERGMSIGEAQIEAFYVSVGSKG